MKGEVRIARVTDEKRERVVHLLKTTELPFATIGRRLGLDRATVSKINRVDGIRDPNTKSPRGEYDFLL